MTGHGHVRPDRRQGHAPAASRRTCRGAHLHRAPALQALLVMLAILVIAFAVRAGSRRSVARDHGRGGARSRARGASPQAWPRCALAGATRALSRRRGARRSRHLDHLQAADARGHSGQISRELRARARREPDRAPVRPAGRGLLRGAPARARREAHSGLERARHLDSRLSHRDLPHHHLRRVARLAPGLRPRRDRTARLVGDGPADRATGSGT